MGIYESDEIYGIRIYNFIKDNNIETILTGNILFERIFDTIISIDSFKEAKIFYDGLGENDKNKIVFKIYVSYTTTYNEKEQTGKIWLAINEDVFLQKCGIST